MQNYFNCTDTNPLEAASSNQQFYNHLVAEFGSSVSNAFLWPGEQIHSLIVSLIIYRSRVTATEVLNSVDFNIEYYKGLYKKLTNTFFIN